MLVSHGTADSHAPAGQLANGDAWSMDRKLAARPVIARNRDSVGCNRRYVKIGKAHAARGVCAQAATFTAKVGDSSAAVQLNSGAGQACGRAALASAQRFPNRVRGMKDLLGRSVLQNQSSDIQTCQQ